MAHPPSPDTPPDVAPDISGARSLTEDLAVLLHRPVDADTRRLAAWHLTDWLGCAIGGHRSEVALLIVKLARETPLGPIHAIGAEKRSADVAILLNAALGGILELDDAHRSSITHPGAIVIPAALAAAEIANATPAALLDGITRGYEATIRIGTALGREHYRYWHNTVTAGVFGAAAAAGSLFGLDEAALVSALGNAGSTAGGLWQMHNEPVMTKHWHYAQAALNGLRTALLAARGFTGPRFVLDGPQGLFAATAPHADTASITEAKSYWLMRDVSFKPWAASRHVHPAIDASLHLRSQLGAADLKPDKIARVTVATYSEALGFSNIPQPLSIHDAKFSLQHGVAIALLRGSPKLSDFESSAVHAPEVARLRTLIELREDPSHSSRFPGHFGATLDIEMVDGRHFTQTVKDVKGDPERPITIAELVDKAEQLMVWSGVLDQRKARRLIETALYLPESPSLHSLLKQIP
ncbi:MmgE/PrpD family protein [Govanella unica]|uniref:MmgE/PrpD family protein n=1 Tax=Govanella unica TaxID=2975056 RepID=A0A9X3U037_9PROT|nr:MmgE/PrpD family protein [Govania unica]MDA5194847.1 MmgE/PrpD family protein [Govania unica]